MLRQLPGVRHQVLAQDSRERATLRLLSFVVRIRGAKPGGKVCRTREPDR